MRDMVRVALADRWWPPVTPSTADATIGGCVAMNMNGKNAWKCGSFGEHLLSITVLLATGQVLTLSLQTLLRDRPATLRTLNYDFLLRTNINF